MIINNAQIAAAILSGAKTANAGAASPATQSAGSGPAAILNLTSGGQGAPSAPGYGADDPFAVKNRQSRQDRQIQTRMALEEAWDSLNAAFDKLDAGERVNPGEIAGPALKIKGLLEEQGLLSDALAKRLDALADEAAQDVSLQSLEAIAVALEEQGVSVEDADDPAAEVKQAVDEQAEAELSEEAAADIAEKR